MGRGNAFVNDFTARLPDVVRARVSGSGGEVDAVTEAGEDCRLRVGLLVFVPCLKRGTSRSNEFYFRMRYVSSFIEKERTIHSPRVQTERPNKTLKHVAFFVQPASVEFQLGTDKNSLFSRYNIFCIGSFNRVSGVCAKDQT